MPVLPPPLRLDTEKPRMLVIISIVLPILATITLAGRFVLRRVKRAGFGPDDYVLIPVLLSVYAECVILVFSVVFGGVGHHESDLSPENITTFYKLLVISLFTFSTSLGLAKISLCLLIVRIFPSARVRIAAYVVLGYCVCWTLMVFSIDAGICQPLAFYWDKTIPHGHCGQLDAAYVSIAAFDIIGDLMIIALPMRQIWQLHTRTTMKVYLSILFALGSLNIIVAILRIVYLLQISFAPGSDVTWQATDAYAWSLVEPCLACIVANGAVFAPAIERGVQFTTIGWKLLASATRKILSRLSGNSPAPSSGDVEEESTKETEVPRFGIRRTTITEVTSSSV